MKAFLFITPKKKRYTIYQAYFSVLGEICDITQTLSDADVVFIMGAWNAKGARLASQSCKMGIPYIVCPLGDLSCRNREVPFLKRAFQSVCYQKKMYSRANLVIATTPMEKNYLMRLGWNKNVTLLRNPSYTHLSTESEISEGLYKIGATTLSDFEQHKAEMIASRTKDAIVAQIMQIQTRMPHRNIPHQYLEDLHALLYADNYDEDALNAELATHKLSSFAAAVFQAMSEKTGLTEGFMPIPAWKGRKSKQILNYIT